MLTWPVAILTPRDIEVTLFPLNVSGGRSMAGFEQVLASDAGFWSIVYGSIPINTPAEVAKWREWQGITAGRAFKFFVPILPAWQSKDTVAVIGHGTGLVFDIPFSDESLFDDDSGFSQITDDPYTGDFAAHSTVIDMKVTAGSAPTAGVYFTLLDRLYLIMEVLEGEAVSGGVVYRMAITPPLRTDVEEDEEVNFATPYTICRLLKDDGMSASFSLARYADPTVEFVEAF